MIEPSFEIPRYILYHDSISIFEYLSFVILSISFLYVFYKAWLWDNLGLYFMSLSLAIFLSIIMIQMYVGLIGSWDPLFYRFYYFFSVFLAPSLAMTALTLYTGYSSRVYWYYFLYNSFIAVIFLYMIFTSEIKEFFLETPYVGGLAFPHNVRIIRPLITIPASAITLYYPVKYFLRYRDRYDALVFSLSTLILIIAGFYLRFGGIALFKYFELVAALGFLATIYLILVALE